MRNKLIELLQTPHKAEELRKAGKEIPTDDGCVEEIVADFLILNGVIAPINVTDNDFKFEYGIVSFKHRFSIKRSLDDYEEITLYKCICMAIEYNYKTMACDELIAEMQIVYKDENNKLHCLCKDLHEYTFEIKHKGNMQINL